MINNNIKILLNRLRCSVCKNLYRLQLYKPRGSIKHLRRKFDIHCNLTNEAILLPNYKQQLFIYGKIYMNGGDILVSIRDRARRGINECTIYGLECVYCNRHITYILD